MFMPGFFNDSFFDDFVDGFFAPEKARPRKPMQRIGFPIDGMMRTDVKESDNAFELTMDLPGYTKDNVKAELKKGYLVITATREQENNDCEEGCKYVCKERYYGSATRSFYVGKDVTEEDIKARFDNGILKITVPKKETKPEIEEKKYIEIGD